METTHSKLQAAFTAAKQAPMMPTASTILAIHTLGLNLDITKFEGQSKMT